MSNPKTYFCFSGCYTVYSAPNKERGILGGVVTVGKSLEIEGNIFSQCSQEDAVKYFTANEESVEANHNPEASAKDFTESLPTSR